jgi:hypothetical protein
VHKRRTGVAVDSGVSSRTTVRTQTGGTQFRSSGSSQTVGGGANVRERSSGQGNQGNIGASSSQGQSGAAQGGQGGQTTGRSGASGSSGQQQMPANR